MFYTVRIYEHGVALFGDPSWGHVVSTVARCMADLKLEGLGCLATVQHQLHLARVERHAPAVVVCWTDGSRAQWLTELEEELASRPPGPPGHVLVGWGSACLERPEGHVWRPSGPDADGRTLGLCSACDRACRPEECLWDDLVSDD